MVDTKWVELVTVYSNLPVNGDRMPAKWADKSEAKVFIHDTMGLNGIFGLRILGRPYILGGCLCLGLILL